MAGCLPAADIKCGRKHRDQERTMSKRNHGLNDFGHLQPMQIAKDAKMKTFTVRKACSGEKVKAVATKPFANISDQKVRAFGHTKISFKRLNT